MSRRVLVVDDDRQMVRTIQAILDHRGWQSIGAFSGEEAVASAAARPFDAVLMDVRMTGITGVEACRAIHATHPRTPVILMTAYAELEVLTAARQSGAVAVLPKPLAWPKLMAQLDRLAGGPA